MKSIYYRSLVAFLFGSRTAALSDSVIETDVVIVGGGPSGLSAAYTLHGNGLNKVVVLEAKEALGGRCRSIQRQSGEGIVELGATWINNKTQPEVFALAEYFGLDTAEQYTEGDLVHEDLEGAVHRVDNKTASNVCSSDARAHWWTATNFS